MRVQPLEREQLVPASLDGAFAFFAHARNLERIFDFRRDAVRRQLG